jgi:hypothetical protein
MSPVALPVAVWFLAFNQQPDAVPVVQPPMDDGWLGASA